MSTTNDLQSLLASLKPRISPTATTSGQPDQNSTSPLFNPNPLLQSLASSDLASAPAAGPSKQNLSPMASRVDQGVSAGGNEKSKSLLSLLKFSQPSNQSNVPKQPAQLEKATSEAHSMRQETIPGKGLTASDLMASFLTPQSTPGIHGGGNALGASLTAASSHRDVHAPPIDKRTHDDPPNPLLKLLNRTVSSGEQQKVDESRDEKENTTFIFGRPSNTNQSNMSQEDVQTAHGAREDFSAYKSSPVRMFGSSESKEATPFEPPPSEVKESKPIFTYTNPFDALHASRKGTPRPSGQQNSGTFTAKFSPAYEINGDKRKMTETVPGEVFTRRKLTPKGPLRSYSSADPSVQHDHNSEKPGTSTPDSRQEVQKTRKDVIVKKEEIDTDAELEVISKKLEETVMNTAIEAEKGLDKKENQRARVEDLPSPVVNAVKEVIDDVVVDAAPTNGNLLPNEPAKSAPRDVPVYNFPLKPFVSITIRDIPPSQIGLRDDGVMEISRFKKEFDQLDRTLAAATSKYIAYAFVKNGGMRVIRQDDGLDRQVFKNSGDRIFHMTLCTTSMTSSPTDEQGLLGVGLSGTVYYTTISKQGGDLFENDSLDAESLVFPPVSVGVENGAGATFKTRLRSSSRHPEFFAIGGGRAIHLIWPSTVMSAKYGVSGSDRTVDVEKLYKDRPLKIAIGKAGKDFIFSEDDTAIISLDKTGKLKFWDIRKLVDESTATASKVQAEEISAPILSLPATSPAEKAWPTSVLFVDKVRPYVKATALRYVLVGLKQNHTLQLWDIALGKVVQELNFPHGSERDGICSVSYHAHSGIIVVGHPTRNSIFFLTLSAPRYTLQAMSQATYLERVAAKDPTLSKLEATACISGMREISFSSKGQLRSLDMLPAQRPVDVPKEAVDDQVLFELYAVHSKGVTCLTIKKEDVGWGPDGKILHAVDDAVEAGLISLTDLRRPLPVEEVDVSGAAGSSQTNKLSKKKGLKGNTESITEATDAKHKLPPVPPTPQPAATHPNGVKQVEEGSVTPATPSEKERKKKKKYNNGNVSAPPPEILHTSNSLSHPSSPSKTPATTTDPISQEPSHVATNIMADDQRSHPFSSGLSKENYGRNVYEDRFANEFRHLEASVSSEFVKQLDKLYQCLENDRHVQDAASSSRQEAVLRLVSSSLSSNIEHTLHHIVGQQIQQVILPAVTTATDQVVRAQLGEVLTSVLRSLVPQEIGTRLPSALAAALQNEALMDSVTENITSGLTSPMKTHFTDLMQSTISPAFQQIAVSAAEKATVDIETRVGEKLQQFDRDRQHDAGKVEMLQAALQQMMEMLSHLSEGQIAFQEKIVAQLTTSSNQVSSNAAGPSKPTPFKFPQVKPPPRQLLPAQRLFSASSAPVAPLVSQKTPEETENAEIGMMLTQNKFEDASIKWLQSDRATELFDQLFVHFTPDYLDQAVSPLVAFSVGITVANSFENNIQKRLDWIYTALNTVDTEDEEMRSASEHCPPLLTSLILKLEQLLIANMGRERQLTRKISMNIVKAKEVHARFLI